MEELKKLQKRLLKKGARNIQFDAPLEWETAEHSEKLLEQVFGEVNKALDEVDVKNVIIRNSEDRIDNDTQGRLDDVVVCNVEMFRMERMNDSCFWIRCYRRPEYGQDVVFWLNAELKDGKLELTGSHHYDGNADEYLQGAVDATIRMLELGNPISALNFLQTIAKGWSKADG